MRDVVAVDPDHLSIVQARVDVLSNDNYVLGAGKAPLQNTFALIKEIVNRQRFCQCQWPLDAEKVMNPNKFASRCRTGRVQCLSGR